jgi:hypothetical protein
VVVDQRFEAGTKLYRVKVLGSAWEAMKESMKTSDPQSAAPGSAKAPVANKNGRL